MRIIEPDSDRVVDLPGAGPTARPVEIGLAESGFSDLLSLCIDEIAEGTTVEDQAKEEVLLVLLAGTVRVEVTCPERARFQLDADGAWALHLPPGSVWRLQPLVPATLARAAAREGQTFAPHAMRPEKDRLVFEGPQGRLRLSLRPLDLGATLDEGLLLGHERLLHLGGPARVEGRDLPPMHTLALAPGELARVAGQGELLALAALGS